MQDAGGGVHGVDFEEAGAGRQAFDEELRGAGFGDADAAGDFVAEGGVPVDFFEGVGFEGQQEAGFGDDEGEGGVGLVGGLGRALGVGEAVGAVVADGGDGGVGGIGGSGGVGVGEKARKVGGIGGFEGGAPRVAEAGGGGREDDRKLRDNFTYFGESNNFPCLLSLTKPIIPVMLGVAAFHFLTDFDPCARPKMLQVVGDLERAARG